MRRTIVAPTLFGLLVACGSPDPTPGPAGTVRTQAPSPADPIDHPPVTLSAAARRLSVQQLRQSFPVTLGTNNKGFGVTWIDDKKQGFDQNAGTLGEADYINVTEETLEATPLYAKFMDDAARSACDQALEADWAKTTASERVLLRWVETTDTPASNAAGVDRNLRYLKLRMHGVKIADDDTTTIAPLRTLLTTAIGASATEAQVRTGWRAVCVALMTAPEFHLY